MGNCPQGPEDRRERLGRIVAETQRSDGSAVEIQEAIARRQPRRSSVTVVDDPQVFALGAANDRADRGSRYRVTVERFISGPSQRRVPFSSSIH